MRAMILATGDELVRGRTLDRNSSEIGRALTSEGLTIVGIEIAPDVPEALQDALRRAAARADVVVLTGGLGPTEDDCTRAVAAAVAGKPLERRAELEAALRARWEARGLRMPTSNLRQAEVPAGAEVLPNRFGTAAGFRVALPAGCGRMAQLFVLPGPPHEMRGVLAEELLPRVRGLLGARRRVSRTRTVDTFGMRESSVGERIADLMGRDARPRVGTSAEVGTIRVVIHADGWADEVDPLLADTVAEVRRRLDRHVFGTDGADLADAAVGALIATGTSVATAESCTGGGLGEAITRVPGASAVYPGGVVAYANEQKTRLLGVEPALFASVGAVSEEVARAMATGARTRFGTDLGLGITGLAGPDGGTDERPVGTVHLAIDVRGVVSHVHRVFPGDRAFVRTLTVKTALDLIRRACV